jgi:CMP-N-acetylneuraminic acid synthetase
MSEVLVTIPARKGSRGVINKNIRPINGLKLLDWTCNLALHLGFDTVLSTDIEDYTPPQGIVKLNRIPSLANSHALAHHVWQNANYEAGKRFNRTWNYHIYLEPTCPLRVVEDVLNCLEIVTSGKSESAFTVSEAPVQLSRMFCLTPDDTIMAQGDVSRPLFANTPRQKLKGNTYYVKNGACYAKTTPIC